MRLGLEQETMAVSANRARRTQTTRHRTQFPADALKRIVADIVERECGVAPGVARPGSFAKRSYVAGMTAIRRDTRALNAPAKHGPLYGNVRAAVVIAAHRACWREMRDGDGQRARFRSQIRCILALTPGYAIWRGPVGSELSGRGSVQWLGGRTAWRTQRLPTTILSRKRSRLTHLRELDNGLGFDAVRRAVLHLLDETGAPMTIEQIVIVLHHQFIRKGGHSE